MPSTGFECWSSASNRALASACSVLRSAARVFNEHRASPDSIRAYQSAQMPTASATSLCVIVRSVRACRSNRPNAVYFCCFILYPSRYRVPASCRALELPGATLLGWISRHSARRHPCRCRFLGRCCRCFGRFRCCGHRCRCYRYHYPYRAGVTIGCCGAC